MTTPSDYLRRILMEMGMSQDDVVALEKKLVDKRAAKEQKETLRDVSRELFFVSCSSR